MPGVEILYLLDDWLNEEDPDVFLYELRNKLKLYPIKVSTKILYNKDGECSLLKIECEREEHKDKDEDEDLEIERIVLSSEDDYIDGVFKHILQSLEIKENEKIINSEYEEQGEEYDGWYGSD